MFWSNLVQLLKFVSLLKYVTWGARNFTKLVLVVFHKIRTYLKYFKINNVLKLTVALLENTLRMG